MEEDYSVTITQDSVNNNEEKTPFNLIVPLGYGRVLLRAGRLTEDMDSFGGKKDDLTFSFYYLPEKLESNGPVPKEITDNLNKLDCVSLVLTKEYAEKFKGILERFINEA